MMKSVENIIVKPVITERSMDGVANKCYTFRVAKDATKPEIAHAVEEMFGVQVENVRTVNVKKKATRYGVHTGFKSAWKKAIVTLTSESKSIAFFDSMN
jgi:large subunit ribosomal protein L23